VVDLDRRTVYLSPLDQRCLFKPGTNGSWLYFEYLEIEGGFTIAPENLRFMRKANP
jgi:hypothetical protein